MVMEEGFSEYTSLPARMAMTAAVACQRSPVAISSASMSVRVARNSRMSRYIAQSLFPYLVSTIRLTDSRWACLASQIATNCTSFSGSIQCKSPVPRLPTPMPPRTIRSLGGTAPFRPSADAGMMQGAAIAPPAIAARLRNCRRVTGAGPETVVDGGTRRTLESGLAVVAFIVLTERLGMRLYPVDSAAWRRVLVPVAGSLAMGFLLYRYFSGARGSGGPQTKAAT